MPEDVILTSLEDRVAFLTFNRPDRMNALSPDLLTKAIETLAHWEEDPKVAVVVVTGAGRAFCAGGDIGGMARENAEPRPLEERIDWLRRAQRLSAPALSDAQSDHRQRERIRHGRGFGCVPGL